MITIMHWLKLVIIMQKLTLVVELWALLSSVKRVLATTMMRPNAVACVNKHVAKLLCVKASNTACGWSLQESYKVLMAYSQLLLFQKILWPTATALFLKKPVYVSIHLLNIIDRAIDLPSEEASVSYPECILRATVH